MPEKVRSGRYDDVIFCITCEQGCSDRVDKGMHGTCLLNPRTAREDEYILKQAERKKKILIVGAGPAGMEAAIISALRGHEVEVYEKERSAGGNFAIAAMPPWKGEISSFIRWQLRQMEKLGVKLLLNTEADKELILSRKPDAVILATGGTAVIPEIDGIQYGFVSLAADVLKGKKHVRGKIAVIGGGSVGAETAFYLAVNEEKPVIIEAKEKIIEDEPEAVRNNMISAFEQYKIPVIVGAKIKKICRNGSIVLIRNEEESVTERFDNVVVAVGYKPFEVLKDELHEKVPEIHMIGDCKEAGNALKAINEGYLLGLKI